MNESSRAYVAALANSLLVIYHSSEHGVSDIAQLESSCIRREGDAVEDMRPVVSNFSNVSRTDLPSYLLSSRACSEDEWFVGATEVRPSRRLDTTETRPMG